MAIRPMLTLRHRAVAVKGPSLLSGRDSVRGIRAAARCHPIDHGGNPVPRRHGPVRVQARRLAEPAPVYHGPINAECTEYAGAPVEYRVDLIDQDSFHTRASFTPETARQVSEQLIDVAVQVDGKPGIYRVEIVSRDQSDPLVSVPPAKACQLSVRIAREVYSAQGKIEKLMLQSRKPEG